MKRFQRFSASIILLFFLLSSSSFPVFSDDEIEIEPIDQSVFKQSIPKEIKIVAPKPACKFAIAMDTLTGRVLFEKNAYIKTPMASTTKIMTAILALEKGNLNDIVTVSARSARVGGSVIHLQKGEQIKLNDLMYGLMLNSGNDAAIAIAEHIGGTVENFTKMMTEKAHELGAYDTSFTTPHGLDKPDHYTTAYDLALITRYALKNKKFSEIVGTRTTVISGPGNTVRHLRNTNEMLSGYSGADGVKTGYTGKAGRCLVSSATKDNWRVISVVLGSSSRHERASDSTKILNYVFNNYKLTDLNQKIEINTHIEVKKGREEKIKITGTKPLLFPIRQDEEDQLRLTYNIPTIVEAPLKKGTKIGTATYNIGNTPCATVDLYIPHDVAKKSIKDYYQILYEELLYSFRYDLLKYVM